MNHFESDGILSVAGNGFKVNSLKGEGIIIAGPHPFICFPQGFIRLTEESSFCHLEMVSEASKVLLQNPALFLTSSGACHFAS